MKKTIIALLALSGVALGASLQTIPLDKTYDLSKDWTLTLAIPRNGELPYSESDTVLLTAGDITLESLTPTIDASTHMFVADVVLSVGENNSVKNSNGSWCMSGGYGYTETVMTLAYVADASEITFTIKSGIPYDGFGEEITTVTLSNVSFDPSDSLSQVQVFDFTAIKGSVSSVLFTGSELASGEPSTPAIPEPTTATLSLLALAGLAARRRRK